MLTHMKNTKKISFLLLLTLLLGSCDDFLVTTVENKSSNLKMINSFKFLKIENNQLVIKADISGKVDEATKTIAVIVPKSTVVTNLIPTFLGAPKSTVTPGNKVPQDFTNPVNYTVTAQNGTQIFYTVTITFAAK